MFGWRQPLVQDVRPFNVQEQLAPGRRALIVGRRCSGKSVLVADLLSRMRSGFGYGLVMSPSPHERKALEAYVPKAWISKPCVERLRLFESVVRAVKARDAERKRSPRQSILVCEDCNDVLWDGAMRQMFPSSDPTPPSTEHPSQHSNDVTCLLPVQSVLYTPLAIRTNADLVFLSGCSSDSHHRVYHEQWFKGVPWSEYQQMFSECTTNFGWVVVDVRKAATAEQWRDYVFSYRTELPLQPNPSPACVPTILRVEGELPDPVDMVFSAGGQFWCDSRCAEPASDPAADAVAVAEGAEAEPATEAAADGDGYCVVC